MASRKGGTIRPAGMTPGCHEGLKPQLTLSRATCLAQRDPFRKPGLFGARASAGASPNSFATVGQPDCAQARLQLMSIQARSFPTLSLDRTSPFAPLRATETPRRLAPSLEPGSTRCTGPPHSPRRSWLRHPSRQGSPASGLGVLERLSDAPLPLGTPIAVRQFGEAPRSRALGLGLRSWASTGPHAGDGSLLKAFGNASRIHRESHANTFPIRAQQRLPVQQRTGAAQFSDDLRQRPRESKFAVEGSRLPGYLSYSGSISRWEQRNGAGVPAP